MNRIRTLLCTTLLVAPSAIQAQTSSAQENADGAAAQATAEPDGANIVVYGLKGARARELQRTPVAVSAVNAAKIQEQQLTDLSDVGRLIPNTQLNTSGTYSAFPAFEIRGVGVSLSIPSADPAVSVSVDGMPYAFAPGTNVDTFDIESLEVYRGPQGVIQGRNATGGVVSVRTRRPTNTLEAEAQITIGNYGRIDGGVLIAGPIVPDRILGKLAIMRRYSHSFFKSGAIFAPAPNNPTGQPLALRNGNYNESILVRPTLVFKPSETLTISLLGEYNETDNRGPTGSLFQPDGLPISNLATLFGFQPTSGSYVSNEDLQTSTRVKAWRGTVDASLELPDIGVVTSITGYRDVRYNTELDTDATPFTIVQFPGNRQLGRQFSQELRFASTFSESFEFVVGGYYSSYDLYVLERRNFSGLLLNRPQSQIASFQGITDQAQKTAAAFGNITWHATSRLSLTAGARYNWERKTVEIAPIRLCPGSFDTCAITRTSGKKSWTDVSPRFAVDFQANDDLLFYASYTKGFRSGAFNSRATVAAAIGPSAPESVASLEAGMKSSWFDNVLKINIAGFHVKYDEIQRTITPPGTTFSQLTNAGDALVDGLEMEVVLKPMRGLELNASLGYLDARYKRFVGLPAGTPPVNELEFPQVPKYTYALNGSYSFSIDGISPKFRASATYSHRSSAYLDSLNPRQSLLEGYGKLDASLSVSMEHITITAFGRNIADKRYYDYVSTLTAGPLFEYVRYGGSPATYGVELSVKL